MSQTVQRDGCIHFYFHTSMVMSQTVKIGQPGLIISPGPDSMADMYLEFHINT